MSKKKSLGSSPIGYSSLGKNSFKFIPTIKRTKNLSSNQTLVAGMKDEKNQTDINSHCSLPSSSDEAVEKRIVSYYLEEQLVERLKRVAEERKMYYSTLVNQAIYLWLQSRGCD